MSVAALPLTETPCWTFRMTRSYCSISDTAARSTSTRVTGSVRVAWCLVAREDERAV